MTIESTLFDRAKEALGVNTSKEMAAKLGLAESSVSSWKAKDSIPADYLKKIAETRYVSLDWLILGKGKKYGEGKYSSDSTKEAISPEEIIAQEQDQFEKIQKRSEKMQGFMLRQDEWTPEEAEFAKQMNLQKKEFLERIQEKTAKYLSTKSLDILDFDTSKYISIPCFDIEASAGSGSIFDFENVLDEVMFSRVWMHAQGLFQKDLVCIQVKGDSMSGLLEDGDTVLVNTARQHGDGVFVIRIGEQVRIKRLQWLSDGQVKLISENPAYENELIDPKQLGDAFQVLGAAHTKIGRLS